MKKMGKRIYLSTKRILDFIFSVLGIIICMPIFNVVGIAIKIDSKGPIIFKQKRIGKQGKVFEIYKFRSMVVNAEKDGVYSTKGDARVTKVGKFIRKTSIDELPQLFNILKGEMSFIGPRPVLTYHPWNYEEYTEEQLKRFLLRPGVTGWAQIHGRKDVEWNHRIQLDVYYEENLNFLLDLRIFVKTIYNVIMMKDNYNIKETAVSNEVKEEKENNVEVNVHNK